MQETKWDIKSMTIEELAGVMKENGFPAFRAKQLYRWMHVSLVRNYEEMTNIPKVMAERLSKEYPLTTARMIDRQVSKLDGTQKYLCNCSEPPVYCRTISAFPAKAAVKAS